ncbi:hypothetical protein CVT26_015795 [Gymnopilus dilepis]|uniref:Calcineurin-like phosphoesterase domain-containing protein n=1 Tax=Gymnopilus dilepis TaxID=231916 RepID=A0A409W4G6_9AGAR|nr:hypothetical protein CVT26_015795 [Gymnopilus dilepis]
MSFQPNSQSQSHDEVIFRSSNEVVYLEYYSIPELPAKPSSEWTRFVCISDTHSRSFEVPNGDVLLHSGDLTNHGTIEDLEKTMSWLEALPHKTKIIIAGNHDMALHPAWYEKEWQNWHKMDGKQVGLTLLAHSGARLIEVISKQDTAVAAEMVKGDRAKKAGIVYLEDEEYKFQVREGGKTWSIYGSPWSPEFFNLAFNYSAAEAKGLVSKIPKTDILMTHTPAHHVLDRITLGDNVGCPSLRSRLTSVRPRLHLSGHIHEAHGAYIHTWASANNFEPPKVQNDDTVVSTSQIISGEGGEETTVFVNAANWPMGPKASRKGVNPDFGKGAFQAVVVDLKE